MPILMFAIISSIYLGIFIINFIENARGGAEEDDLEKADFEDLEPFSKAMSEDERSEMLDNENYFK